VDRLKVGFIGAGRIADLHAAAYRDNPDAELYAVCELTEETAIRRADEWGASRWFTDYHEMLADKALDAVEILTPHHLHAEMAVAALEAGKHVALQKPHTLNLTEMDQVIAAAQRSGKLFRGCDNFLYYPPYNKARQLMDEGAIGEPISFRMKVLGGTPRGGWPVPPETWQWHLREGQSGRGLTVFDHGVHVCALAIYFLGPVDKAFAWIQRREVWPGIVLDAPVTAIWKYSEGIRYGMWDALSSPELVIPTKYYGGDEWVEITGSRGVIWVNRCSGEMLEGPALVLYRDGETRAFQDLETDWGVSFVRQGQDFIAAIREGRPCTLTGPEARRVLQFVLAVHVSAKEERPVKVDEIVD